MSAEGAKNTVRLGREIMSVIDGHSVSEAMSAMQSVFVHILIEFVKPPCLDSYLNDYVESLRSSIALWNRLESAASIRKKTHNHIND